MELDSHYNHLSKPLLLCFSMLLTLTSTISLSLSFSSLHVAEGLSMNENHAKLPFSHYLNVNDANSKSSISQNKQLLPSQQNNTAAVSIVENASNPTKSEFQSISSIVLDISLVVLIMEEI